MSLNATSRRAVRTLAHRVSIDWSRPVWSMTPEAAAGFSKLRAWVGMAESMAEKYSQPPTPPNFAATKKSVRDTEFIANLEAFYKTTQIPPETHAMPEVEKKEFEETVTYLKDLDALHKESIPVLEKEIKFCQETRTTKDTTMFDMQINYPMIHEEIEDELDRREWFKDTEYDKNRK